MAYSAITRSLRDGAIVIKDGDSPVNVCTVACDDGSLRWTERYEKVVTRCRGTISSRRTGDEQEVQLSFSVHWRNLVNAAVESGSASYMPYEFINFLPTEMVSTTGGLNTLDYHFTCTDPADTPTATELIVFDDVFCTELTCQEGDPNTIEFSGEGAEERPTITQP